MSAQGNISLNEIRFSITWQEFVPRNPLNEKNDVRRTKNDSAWILDWIILKSQNGEIYHPKVDLILGRDSDVF